MTLFQHKKVLFHQKEITGYLCMSNEKWYRVYEIKDEKILHTLLLYQERWQYEVSLVYKYPIFIFKHDALQWYVFKELHTFTMQERFKICLSFLEKLLLMQATNEEILFFCDSTNLWFNEQFQCELFYNPKVTKLKKEVLREEALMILARFIFRHLQLAKTLENEEIYNKEYVAFYHHVFTEYYYSSLLQIYDEVYKAYITYHKQEVEVFSLPVFLTKAIATSINLAIIYVIIIYSVYAVGMLKKIYDEQYHDLYVIGNQSLQQSGEVP